MTPVTYKSLVHYHKPPALGYIALKPQTHNKKGRQNVWSTVRGWSAELRMIRHMRLSVSSPIRNYTSGKVFISWPRIVHIRLPRQVDPSSGTYIRKTRYQLIYDRISGGLDLLSGSYIRKVLPQLVQDHTHQDASLYYRDCTSGRLFISLFRITHNMTPRTTIGILHPEGCTSAHQGWDALGYFSRNALWSGWASGCLAFTILLVPKGAVQESCAADAPEATE